MQLKNINFIQKQRGPLKKQLSISYMRASTTNEKPEGISPAFKLNMKGVETPSKVEEKDEGFSLANQIEYNRTSTFNKNNEGSQRDSNLISAGDIVKVSHEFKREKSLHGDKFQNREYFKNKLKEELEIIEEDEDNKSSSIVLESSSKKKEPSPKEPEIPDEPSGREDSFFQKSASTVNAEVVEELKQKVEERPEQKHKYNPDERETLIQNRINMMSVGGVRTSKVGGKDILSSGTKTFLSKFSKRIKDQNRRISEVLGTAGIDIRPSRITTFDFLSIRKNEKIAKMLTSQGHENSMIIFST